MSSGSSWCCAISDCFLGRQGADRYARHGIRVLFGSRARGVNRAYEFVVDIVDRWIDKHQITFAGRRAVAVQSNRDDLVPDPALVDGFLPLTGKHQDSGLVGPDITRAEPLHAKVVDKPFLSEFVNHPLLQGGTKRITGERGGGRRRLDLAHDYRKAVALQLPQTQGFFGIRESAETDALQALVHRRQPLVVYASQTRALDGHAALVLGAREGDGRGACAQTEKPRDDRIGLKGVLILLEQVEVQ
ncbi:hypothetical protein CAUPRSCDRAFT_12659, partial [Caulochytrium protostelioides]